jgi:hypothetical protein
MMLTAAFELFRINAYKIIYTPYPSIDYLTIAIPCPKCIPQRTDLNLLSSRLG